MLKSLKFLLMDATFSNEEASMTSVILDSIEIEQVRTCYHAAVGDSGIFFWRSGAEPTY